MKTEFPIRILLTEKEYARIDAWIRLQSEPSPTREDAFRRLAMIGAAAERQRRAAQRCARAAAAADSAASAREAYAQSMREEDQKTERLRLVRLAKAEHDQRVLEGKQKAAVKRAARGVRGTQESAA